MLIRDADPVRDGAGCAAVYGPFVRDTVISFEDQPPDERELARRIEHTTRTHPWLVAEVGGELAGYAYATRHRDRHAYRWAANVTVYVAPPHHRRGIGRALYGALMPLLVRQGLFVACAGVTLPNDASVGFHESFGFIPVGVYRRIGWKAGAWWDVGWWELELASPVAGDGQPPEPGPPVRLGR
jgi:L-amino acid N-acyltransferase YncA